MQSDRIPALLKMLEARPGDPRARFGLALEYGADVASPVGLIDLVMMSPVLTDHQRTDL